MFVSERFLATLARIRKSSRGQSIDELHTLVESAFLAVMHLPTGMAEEIYELIAERIVARLGGEESEAPESFIDAARYLGDVADLFGMQYDEENDPLVAEDWGLIGEIVNEWAFDLDMPLVNYVMRIVVDHHGV